MYWPASLSQQRQHQAFAVQEAFNKAEAQGKSHRETDLLLAFLAGERAA